MRRTIKCLMFLIFLFSITMVRAQQADSVSIARAQQRIESNLKDADKMQRKIDKKQRKIEKKQKRINRQEKKREKRMNRVENDQEKIQKSSENK